MRAKQFRELPEPRVLIDLQFIGGQIAEIAIAAQILQFPYTYAYNTCVSSCEGSLSRHNQRYLQMYCCNSKNRSHRRGEVVNTMLPLKLLPREGCVFVCRGANKVSTLRSILNSLDFSATNTLIYTFPESFTHNYYSNCSAHRTGDAPCAARNVAQMCDYYNYCRHYFNSTMSRPKHV